MSCEPFEILMMKHMDGDITDIEYKKLKKHIDECSTCKNEFDTFENICYELKEPLIDPPLAFETEVMKKLENLNLYNKKLKEKRILAAYFISSMLFSILAICIAVIYKEHVYNFMIYINIPLGFASNIYGLLERIAVFFDIASTFIFYLNSIFVDMLYLLIGLVSIIFMSKIYESAQVAKVRKNSKKTV
ncbi:UNVERIFIED_CONTAM: hypothetical protein Cloal_0022 [Acetivibrio alkalicellulosi]